MRDWLSSLFPASYAGVPFWVERDTAEGGREIVIHRFPHRDGSFNEDMAADVRTFRVAAYVASDSADGEAAALVAALAQEGPATLVLPIDGVVLARAMKPWTRTRDRDRFGYISFDLTFVAETPEVAGTSATFLATLASAAVDALGGVLSSVVGVAGDALSAVVDVAGDALSLGAAIVDVVGAPGYVVDAAASVLADGVVALETVRAETPVAPALAGTLAAQTKTLFAAAPAAVSRQSGVDPVFVQKLVQAARDLAAASTSPATPSAFLTAAAAFPAPDLPAAPPATAARIAGNAVALSSVCRLALLAGAVDSALAANYPSRPAAFVMRAALVQAIDREAAAATDLRAVDVLVALGDLRQRIGEWFALEMTTLKPVVVVRSATSLPSLVLAWSLYGDASRAQELIDRNDVAHPSFMPEQIEALAA